ncbi:MAG: 50S ribosomal protein L5 [Deltaproteobacteria bacterium]|nr:50S ribosomal protein L5 [Deltaproteobacteria bacterium]
MSRLQEKYQTEAVPKLKAKYGYKNVHQIPRLEKVVINMGVGEAVQNIKAIEMATADLALISGQRPVIRRARKSIANFKLREGTPIGVSVTLRRKRMYEFADRLINVVLPRVRDFRGVSKNSFDGAGNYSFGFSEQIIFPEIDMDKTQIRGLNVTFVTSARTDEEGRELMVNLGFPFRQ